MMEFKREELQKIRTRADSVAGNYVMNHAWKRAYIALSDAANTLDALIARLEEEKKKMDVSPEKE